MTKEIDSLKRDYKFGDYYDSSGGYYIMDDMGNAHELNDSVFNQKHFFYVDWLALYLLGLDHVGRK